MKILEIVFTLGCGGGEHFVVDLCNELSNDNEVYLLTLMDDKKDPEIRNFYRSDVSERVRLINLGLPNGFHWSSQWKVVKAIKSINPDIVHGHLCGFMGFAALAVIMLSHKYPFFQTVHGNFYAAYAHGFNKFVYTIYGSLLKRVKLACLSPENYADCRQVYPRMDSRCIVNGRAPMIPTQDFISVQQEMNCYKKNEQTRLYLHVARFDPIKDQNLLIDSFNEFVDKGYNADLVIIGAYYDSKEGSVLQSKACNRIHFIGAHHNIPDYMLNADVFCLSSKSEGMPITLIEAGLAGVPAVSTPVGGAVDMIQNGINGYLSEDHTQGEFVKALILAYDNFEQIKNNAEIMTIDNPYTMKECAKKYLDFFKTAL